MNACAPPFQVKSYTPPRWGGNENLTAETRRAPSGRRERHRHIEGFPLRDLGVLRVSAVRFCCTLGGLNRTYGLSPAEWKALRRLGTPGKIQRFLDTEIAYNKEPGGPTCRSPRRVLRDRVAHCLEGALFGAAALRANGRPPLVLDLEAVRDDDHVLAVFRERGHWGAIAKSNYAGLRYREPVYRTLRELAISYFEHYYNLEAEKTLRAYSRTVNLGRFDRIEWMTAEEDLWPVSDYLFSIPHYPLLAPGCERRLSPVDHRSYHAGMHGAAH